MRGCGQVWVQSGYPFIWLPSEAMRYRREDGEVSERRRRGGIREAGGAFPSARLQQEIVRDRSRVLSPRPGL